MVQRRRDILKALGLTAVGGSIAGCTSGSGSEGGTPTGSVGGSTTEEANASAAVATELNVYRSRLYDASALGRAGEFGLGASVVESTFQRFESATGEYGAHERLEATSQEAYEGFESSLTDLGNALDAEDTEAAADAATTAAGHLRDAQESLAGEAGTHALDMYVFGSRALNASVLANAGLTAGAQAVAQAALADFEEAAVHDAVEAADGDAYERFESGLETVVSAAESGASQRALDQARESAEGATAGAYALTTEAMAGASHIGALQARGWDAAAVSTLGGPGERYAHAGTLNSYRARAYDAQWLARRGETDTAATMASDIFAHFEGARAHEGLEEADHEAYETFEAGLSDLQTAIEDGNTTGIDSAVTSIDGALRTGIDALAGGYAPVLQSGFFKSRLADARELYRQDKNGQAATIVSELFARFETNELDFHETVEETDEDLYHRFEDEHLTALQSAYENDDESAVETHHQGVLDALLAFEEHFSAAVASGAGATYMAALGFDAAAVDALGHPERAATIGQNALAYFESGAAGYHEALESADESLYTRFEEETLEALISAANDGEAVSPAAKSFGQAAVDSLYAIVAAGGGGSVATSITEDIFLTFEQARVHELLETTDHDAYESFEAELESYSQALQGGDADPTAFADAARTAQFAVLSAGDAAPAGDSSSDSEEETEEESSLSGGPNVVSDVPDDADHVVDVAAATYEPAELTVERGDTVAFEHVGGEAHTVTAYEEQLPEEATYWASGGFESESEAREGWENGTGAVQSGQSYVYTFETAGTYPYFCIPHEMAGMEGTIIVE